MSIAAAKAALVDIIAPLLPATDTLPAAQVLPGPVDVTTLGPRAVVVGDRSTPIRLDVTSLGGGSGTQTFTLMVTASVSLPGTDLGLAEDQAIADFADAVDAIQADPSLGLANLSATVTGEGELVEDASAQGRSAAVRFPVEVFTTL